MEKKEPLDPSMTIEVDNSKLEAMISEYRKDNSRESLDRLVNYIVACRVLVPATIGKDKTPIPILVKNEKGEAFMPVYTSKSKVPSEPKTEAVMNMPYLAINQIAAKNNELVGIVLNPFGENLVLRLSLLRNIEALMQLKRDVNPENQGRIPEDVIKQGGIKLNEKEINLMERRKFESNYMPKRFFEEPQAFVEELLEKKEELIDQLYEESYQNKRLYPYLPEDFSVMAMNISDDLTVVRIEMPAKDIYNACAICIYVAWDKAKELAKYFTIEHFKVKEGNQMSEVTKDLRRVHRGSAPVEGAELQKVLDMLEDEGTLTS